jgi:hypothetical protein
MGHAYHIDLLGNSFCKMAMAICMSEKCTTKKLLNLSISLKKLVGHMGLTNLLGCDSSDTCVLLSHPQQRCAQDEFDAPKDLAKLVAPVPCTSSSGGLPQLRKEGEDDGSGAQDEFDAPKDLAKMVAPVPCTSSSGGLPQLRKEGEDDGSGPRTF